MHEITPQKAKICRHARKKCQYLESLSHETNTVFASLESVTSLYKNMHLHGNPGSSDYLTGKTIDGDYVHTDASRNKWFTIG